MDAESDALEPELIALLRGLVPTAWDGNWTREPLASSDSSTEATLDRISITSEQRQYSFVVKRLMLLGEWLARATDDRLIREHAINAAGVYALLPSGVESATLASARTADGAVIVMRDLTDVLLPSGDRKLTFTQVHRIMAGLARMHSALVGFSPDLAQRAGLNSMQTWLTPLAPATARREALQPHRDPFTPLIEPGWAGYAQLAPQSWELIGPLLDDPQPLVDAIQRFPSTLVHGDVKAANLALDGDTLILFDWSTTTAGPGALDLAWFLCINAHRLPCPKADVIEVYRQARAALGVLESHGAAWDEELALALLTSPMRLGWLRGYLAAHRDSARDRAEIDYWAEQSLAARRYLGIT